MPKNVSSGVHVGYTEKDDFVLQGGSWGTFLSILVLSMINQYDSVIHDHKDKPSIIIVIWMKRTKLKSTHKIL